MSLRILIHSSKTMRSTCEHSRKLHTPELLAEATRLNRYLKTLSPAQLAEVMQISGGLAQKTHDQIASWNIDSAAQLPAIDSFIGDIYSGLRANELSEGDRAYADQVLCILSGLYGILRPFDGIRPYRLEMGYSLPDARYKNLYAFWRDKIARCLPTTGIIVNLSSAEYSKVVTQFVDPARIYTPKFMTVNPKTSEPAFVTVHAKIARGAFARWLITSRTTKPSELKKFAELGYRYNPELSTPQEPVFICQEFKGKGLSIRLQSA